MSQDFVTGGSDSAPGSCLVVRGALADLGKALMSQGFVTGAPAPLQGRA